MTDNENSLFESQKQTPLKVKLGEIEQEIQRDDLKDREKKLLQNRKSVMKMNIKKQNQLENLKRRLDQINNDNAMLREEVSALKAVINCKDQECRSLEKKIDDR